MGEMITYSGRLYVIFIFNQKKLEKKLERSEKYMRQEVSLKALQPVFENEKVRVLKVQIKPGEKTEMHTHPNTVLCILSEQKIKFLNYDGDNNEVDLNFGQVLYFEPITHSVENIGTTDAISLVIELKK